jgi:hypothetical protein
MSVKVQTICEWSFVAAVCVAGWYANNGYRYVADLYHKARVCEATQCESIKEMAETMGQPPALTKGKTK